jgi:FG-GAP repeat
VSAALAASAISLGMGPGIAAASSPVPHVGGYRAGSSRGMTLAHAPAGLQEAVGVTLGQAPASTRHPVQQWEFEASVPGTYLGDSVALSGTTAVVGAQGENSFTGAAYVFVTDGATWTQQARLAASDGTSDSDFGWSVAMSGNTVVVGAPHAPLVLGQRGHAGAAYVFARSGTTWSQQAKLTASDASTGSDFGRSVAIDRGTVVVGEDEKGAYLIGAAYVFVRSHGLWSQQAQLTPSDTSGTITFGFSVAVSGATVAVGAPNEGTAYVFAFDGTTWLRQAELGPSAGATGTHFGASVAISGTTMAVGAPLESSNAGAVYAFVTDGTSWTQQAELTAPGGAPSYFGQSVAISGTTALVGANLDNSFTGAAYVLVTDGTTWTQRAKLTASDGSANDSFGWSVALHATTALVGVFHKSGKGSAYVFVGV